MAETIGKYRILERIGRGGMGMIFKAHDPVLDRSVALKVISTEVEVTDELRARFFREAQACARLSHPNIITVYDMGEDDGRLFIVMELLEGEELKRLVAQRKALALEDKLAIMVQVCDGLHYAHQKGIVHRDIKPGNIFVLRSGQVKILDFGIAQIANTEGGLTRTGLIMGTLRYISPEQVRGRADARSDMFSVGAVFYEFLSLRPPFTGEDPMQLLEQLRTEDPPPLNRVDPTIPVELAAVVERAMRKDPAERFTDLEQMRFQLEEVQRGLTEEAQRLGARVRDQHGQLLQLRAALAERIGPTGQDETVPTFDGRGRLATMQALERDFAGRIEAQQAKIARADSLAPAFERATELLQAGQLAEAIEEFEAIVAEMPEHARALDGLAQARGQAEAQRRRQLARKLMQDARSALDEGGHTLCLEILNQAAEIPPPAEMIEEIGSLRQTAEAALAAQEAARRARQQAEGARAQMAQARRAAQAQAEPEYAPALWNEAEAKSAEAEARFAREAYADAGQAFDAATAVYHRFEEAGRVAKRREREAAEQAREQVGEARGAAQAEGAPQYARELWDAAEAKSAEAQAAFHHRAIGRAAGIFNEASALYGRAEEAGRAARQERRRAEEARRQVAQAREGAQAAGAPHYARELWDGAEPKLTEAEAAFARHAYAHAAQAFEAAAATYRNLEVAAREARRREREAAEQARGQMVEARRAAQAEGAPQYALGLWDEAEAKAGEAEATLAREAHGEARAAFEAAAATYRNLEVAAREARRREREAAEHAREQAVQARRAAEAQASAQYAPGLWDEAEAKSTEAAAALAQGAYGEARAAFATAVGAYRRVEGVAREAQEREAAEHARDQAAQGRERAQAGDAPRYARELWEVAQAKFAEAQGALARKPLTRAAEIFNEASGLYARAEEASREARQRERRRAEEARERATQSQRGAAAVDAERHAPSLWNEAVAKSADAEAALVQAQYAKAAESFDGALALYQKAEKEGREARRRQREQAEEGRQGMAERRRSALTADAASHALSDWNEAEASAASGEAAFAREAYAEASGAFDQSTALYRRAEERARNVVRALELARADAEKGREATALVRRAAAEAQASKYASEQWRAGEGTEAEASAALSRREYAAARSLFTEARRHYAAATQAASIAVEAEARRADAMVSDARRLLASGDVAACLRRLNEVLILRPGHAAAEALRLEAEERQRQAAAAAQDVTLHSGPPADSLDQTILQDEATPDLPVVQGVPGRCLEVLRGVGEIPATAREAGAEAERVQGAAERALAAERAEAARLEAEQRAREEAERQEVARREAEQRARREAEQAQAAAREASAAREAEAVGAVAAAAESGRGDALSMERVGSASRRRLLPVGIGLGAAAAVVLGLAVYWQTSSTRPIPTAPVAPAPSAPAATPLASPTAIPAEAVKALRERVAAGRAAAAAAGAERLAPATWNAAGEKERAAEAAIKEGDWTAVRTQYGEALSAYGAASAAAAKSSDVTHRETDAQRAREQASTERRAAEAAGAPRLAKTIWAKAAESQRGAETALKRGDFDRAETLFADSAKGYREAEKQASEQKATEAERTRLAAVRQKVQGADEAAATAAGARRNAERAAASRYAPKSFALAQQKEEEARKGLDRQEYESAESGFREAAREYQVALQEAQRASDAERQVASARQRQQQEAEQRSAEARRAAAEMHAKARADREQAVKAGADVLTKDLFAAAATREGEGDRLAAGQDLVAAKQAYQDAAERYGEAGRRAKVVQEAKAAADQARARMAADKQRARQEVPEFAAAVAQERQGMQHYQRLAFKEAGESFAAASDLFAKAAARPAERPPEPRPAPADEVRGILSAYVRAFETKDVALMQRIRPGLNSDEVRRLRESFGQSKEYRVSLKVDSVDVSGDQAVVKGRREDNLVSKGGQSFRNESKFTFRLKRTGDGWIIDTVN